MNYLQKAAILLFGVLLIPHGMAHGPGVLGSWNVTTFKNSSHQPNILLEHVSDGVVSLLGVLFLLAGLTFVGAEIGVLHRAPWWPPAVTAALPSRLGRISSSRKGCAKRNLQRPGYLRNIDMILQCLNKNRDRF